MYTYDYYKESGDDITIIEDNTGETNNNKKDLYTNVYCIQKEGCQYDNNRYGILRELTDVLCVRVSYLAKIKYVSMPKREKKLFREIVESILLSGRTSVEERRIEVMVNADVEEKLDANPALKELARALEKQLKLKDKEIGELSKRLEDLNVRYARLKLLVKGLLDAVDARDYRGQMELLEKLKREIE